MNKTRLFSIGILVVFLFIFATPHTFKGQEIIDSMDLSYAPGKIVIQFTKEISPVVPRMEGDIIQTGIGPLDLLCRQFRVHTIERQFPAPKYPTPDLTRHFVVKFDETVNLDQVVNVFSSLPVYVEKVEKVGLHRFDGNPQDNDFSKQWYLKQTSDCDIDAPEAWDIQRGSDSIILSVADSGVDYSHPDLNDNIWVNEAEYYGVPNHDDDGNGYWDDIYGWDWPDNDNSPTDAYGHGSHCAGIIAAETNNTGIAGIAGGWYTGQHGCKIMCLRIGRGYPEPIDMSYAASAIEYAVDMGAAAINCSWQSSDSGGLKDAVDYATQNGLLVVHSAGNYPTGDHDYLGGRSDVLTVAATNRQDQIASYSNYGSWVDVAAPGGEGEAGDGIYSTYKNGGYKSWSGTSQAAPMVVGLGGLLKSERPSWGRQKIWDAIVQSADYINSPVPIGSGRINAFDALKQTWGLPGTPGSLTAQAAAYNQINLTWVDNINNETEFHIYRKKAGGTYSKIGTARKNAISYQDKTVQPSTKYYYKIKAHNINGDSSYSNEASATTPAAPPQAPSNLNTTGYCWDVELTWQDNSNNEDGFYIYRKTGDQFIQFDYVGPNITTYLDAELFCGELWCYRVSAYNSGGESPLSLSDCSWTLPCYECEYPLGLEIVPDREIIDSGESVSYTYKITNQGPAKLTGVGLMDDQFGIVAGNIILERMEFRTFVKTVTLTETTTNTAQVTAAYTHNNRTETLNKRASATVKVR